MTDTNKLLHYCKHIDAYNFRKKGPEIKRFHLTKWKFSLTGSNSSWWNVYISRIFKETLLSYQVLVLKPAYLPIIVHQLPYCLWSYFMSDFLNNARHLYKVIPRACLLSSRVYREALIAQLQQQVSDLTLFLEEERLNHKATKDKVSVTRVTLPATSAHTDGKNP